MELHGSHDRNVLIANAAGSRSATDCGLCIRLGTSVSVADKADPVYNGAATAPVRVAVYIPDQQKRVPAHCAQGRSGAGGLIAAHVPWAAHAVPRMMRRHPHAFQVCASLFTAVRGSPRPGV